ncbi:MAG TPA: repressor LexA [Anaerolineaceae bacterium]|uniref:LexA repressor n=1 Tax=Anaerolinea thermophila TaxID=167964 RepID=A0A101FYK0_9CHLR|nr:MAG: LexA repressor [Anaerolinea thermophila]HAF61739.1 repressor LexA [Anaerolineaceae bacterium]
MARKSEGLGNRHKKIMRFLVDFQDENGYSPSIREIGESIDVKSTSLVDYYLNQLEEMGYISRENHISRSICVKKEIEGAKTKTATEKVSAAVQKASTALDELLQIPIMGRIVASEPIPMPASDLNYFDPESSIEIARSLLPAKEKIEELFALEVQGDSMIDAMVNDGDVVIMRRTNQAQNGEMVAVWLDDKDETTLKYFYKEPNRIRLQPANPNMGPIYINNPKALRIMGKVVMVIRQVQSVAA